MAHKGREYEVRQSARIFGGNAPWPFWPAKNYIWEGQIEIIGGGLHEFDDLPLDPIDEMSWDLHRRWRSSPFTLDGLSCEVQLDLWGDGSFLMCSQLHQLFISGSEQYEQISEDFFQSNTYEFVTTLAELQVPVATPVGQFVSFLQSNAVPY